MQLDKVSPAPTLCTGLCVCSVPCVPSVLCHVFCLRHVLSGPVLAREHCRINPPHFLSECRMRRLNQASFVLLCFLLFAFSGLSLVFVVCVFNLFSVSYFSAYTVVNGSAYPNCADVLLTVENLLTHSPHVLSVPCVQCLCRICRYRERGR